MQKQAFKVLGHSWVKKTPDALLHCTILLHIAWRKAEMLLLPMQKVIRFVKYGVSQQIFYWRYCCFNSLHLCGVEGWWTGAGKVQSSVNIRECFYKTCCLQYEVMKSISLSADCKCFLQIELMPLVSFHWRPTEARFLAFIFVWKEIYYFKKLSQNQLFSLMLE